jgi:alkylation response protein AidB-like acyl-CoA dehydrogenase
LQKDRLQPVVVAAFADEYTDPAIFLQSGRAVEVDGSYVIIGSKTRISNAPIADVFVIWAMSDAHGWWSLM